MSEVRQKKPIQRFLLIGIGIVFVYVAGIASHWVYMNWQQPPARSGLRVNPNSESFKFINPLLLIQPPQEGIYYQFNALNDQLKSQIKNYKTQGLASDVSVYFREKGHWLGINEQEQYDPASLAKVPIMIAYYHEAEANPQILDKKIIFLGRSATSTDPYPVYLTPRKEYTIEQLIESMIINSDNDAKTLLLHDVDQDYLRQVFDDLSLEYTGNPVGISPADYSLFFRVLYNGTYLSWNYSEKALQLLSQSTFHDGLVAGVPQTVMVAHKYGEFVSYDANNQPSSVELHDCGIVYYPSNTYFLCIMTRGSDLDQLKTVIASISKTVFTEVDKENLKK